MLTNRINVTYNMENIDADFDIFRVEKANKDYYKYNEPKRFDRTLNKNEESANGSSDKWAKNRDKRRKCDNARNHNSVRHSEYQHTDKAENTYQKHLGALTRDKSRERLI